MKFLPLAIVIAAAGLYGPALAADEPGLAPNVPWTLDYDDDSCALRRTFGEGEDQAYLEMRRFGPGLGLQTTIGSKRMDAKRTPVNFRYRFTSDADWREVNGANSLTMNSGFSGVLFDAAVLIPPSELRDDDDALALLDWLRTHDLRAMEVEAARTVTSITVRDAFRRDLTLQLERLDAPMRALNECIDELMTHWGIDVEAHRTLTRSAVPVNLPEVGSMIDYPPRMVGQGLQGVVNIRLGIDETGRVTACRIQMPLSDPEFERNSCADVQHAIDFDPALDKDGKPIASYWVTKIHFSLR